MNPDLDALATRLYVTIDDLLIDHPNWAPERPVVGIAPKLSDAELITLAVIQALLGYTSEARFIRSAQPISPDCSHIFRSGPATTNDSVAALQQCNTSSPRLPATARHGTTTSGWSTRPPSSAAVLVKQ